MNYRDSDGNHYNLITNFKKEELRYVDACVQAAKLNGTAFGPAYDIWNNEINDMYGIYIDNSLEEENKINIELFHQLFSYCKRNYSNT